MEVENTISTTDSLNMYKHLNTYVINPMVLIIIILIIVAYYAFSSSLGSSDLGSSGESSGIGSIFGIIIMTILVVLIVINAFQYFFNVNIIAYIQELFLFPPKIDEDVYADNTTNVTNNVTTNVTNNEDTNNYMEQTTYQPSTVQEIKFKKQVFNIPGNYYTYNDAKALCSAYGAKLANYDQIEQAYNNGAEWCNYGWSANQLALFPTQKKTYADLQTIPGHENDCGRPGINGGYIANPNVKFGVNCYGYKPKIRSDEDELMKTAKPYPETPQDIEFQNKVDMMKGNLDQILVSPFNYDKWSSV
jgi:hypothetical protein